MTDKPKNMLIKNFPETPRKALLDLEVLEVLDPYEFYVYTILLNAEEDFEPTITKFQELLKLSRGKTNNIMQGLKNRGFLDIKPADNKRSYIWYIYNRPLNFTTHRDYLVKSDNALKLQRDRENEEINKQIAELQREMMAATGEELIKITDKIIRLEQTKGKK